MKCMSQVWCVFCVSIIFTTKTKQKSGNRPGYYIILIIMLVVNIVIVIVNCKLFNMNFVCLFLVKKKKKKKNYHLPIN